MLKSQYLEKADAVREAWHTTMGKKGGKSTQIRSAPPRYVIRKIIDRSLPSLEQNNYLLIFLVHYRKLQMKVRSLNTKGRKAGKLPDQKGLFYAVLLFELFFKPSASSVMLYTTWERSSLNSFQEWETAPKIYCTSHKAAMSTGGQRCQSQTHSIF